MALLVIVVDTVFARRAVGFLVGGVEPTTVVVVRTVVGHGNAHASTGDDGQHERQTSEDA